MYHSKGSQIATTKLYKQNKTKYDYFHNTVMFQDYYVRRPYCSNSQNYDELEHYNDYRIIDAH